MNKNDFNALVNYLKNRPEEAEKLAEVLKVNACANNEECTWVGVREAARHLGKSASWVKAHLILFPSTFKTIKNGRAAYKLKKEELRPLYESYLRQNYAG